MPYLPQPETISLNVGTRPTPPCDADNRHSLANCQPHASVAPTGLSFAANILALQEGCRLDISLFSGPTT